MRGRKLIEFGGFSLTVFCIKKESPNEGTETRLHKIVRNQLGNIKKESPNEGTETICT